MLPPAEHVDSNMIRIPRCLPFLFAFSLLQSTTPVRAAHPATVTQTITFSNVVHTTYKGDLKTTFEAGYAINIGIYRIKKEGGESEGYAADNSMASSAVAASPYTYTGSNVTFIATVPKKQLAATGAVAAQMTSASLIRDIAAAKGHLMNAITVPLASEVGTIGAPVTHFESSSSLNWTVIIIIILMIGVIVFSAMASAAHFFFKHGKPSVEPSAEAPSTADGFAKDLSLKKSEIAEEVNKDEVTKDEVIKDVSVDLPPAFAPAETPAETLKRGCC